MEQDVKNICMTHHSCMATNQTTFKNHSITNLCGKLWSQIKQVPSLEQKEDQLMQTTSLVQSWKRFAKLYLEGFKKIWNYAHH